MTSHSLRLGLVVNPVAGIGAEAGLKGSDGAEIQRLARERGSSPRSPERAVRALTALAELCVDVTVLTGAGALGADAVSSAGLRPAVVYEPAAEATTADDTRALVSELVSHDVDVIVFVGGDGTARDVCSVAPIGQLVLGIPAGVKMHSGVFAVTPERAAVVLAAVAAGTSRAVEAEVIDLDEDARRNGILGSTLYGHLNVPVAGRDIQSGKRSSVARGPAVLGGIALELRDRLDPNGLALFGPGTTVQHVGEALGLELSLLGVDVVAAGNVIAFDASADEIDALTEGKRVQVVVSPVGGQGIVLGRGNQQIDARILERLDPADLIIVCPPDKLGPLAGAPLLLDCPTVELNEKFAGLRHIVTGFRQEAILRVQ